MDGTSMKDQAQRTQAQGIHDAIREILLQDWDPICRRSLKPAVFLLAREGLVIIRAEGASGLRS